MTLLAELFDRLESAPAEIAQRQAGVLVGIAENTAPLRATENYSPANRCAAPAAAAPAPAEAASEPTRNAWTITRGGKPICRMVGAPCTPTEALAEARWRWPDADILES